MFDKGDDDDDDDNGLSNTAVGVDSTKPMGQMRQ
jgi:hypothetical protein